MKNKNFIIVFVLLFIILIIFSGLILVDLNLGDVKLNEPVEINDWNIEQVDYGYSFSVKISAEEVNKLLDKKYDIYFLDKNSNLIYLIDNIYIEANGNNDKIFNSQIMYDISGLNKIVVVNSGKKIKYNDNLINKTKYIGILTTTKTTKKNITTQPPKVIDSSQVDY